MKIELLYFDGCPTYRQVLKSLEELKSEHGWDFEIELVNVDTDEKAIELNFVGSPTIRVDGVELFPPPKDAPFARACRMFQWKGKILGAPPKEMLRTAINQLINQNKG